jgi:hypothetical protein
MSRSPNGSSLVGHTLLAEAALRGAAADGLNLAALTDVVCKYGSVARRFKLAGKAKPRLPAQLSERCAVDLASTIDDHAAAVTPHVRGMDRGPLPRPIPGLHHREMPRLHSSLDYTSPTNWEKQYLKQHKPHPPYREMPSLGCSGGEAKG